MNAYSERRLELSGVEIGLYEAGQGEPLLFLHGAGTSGALPAKHREIGAEVPRELGVGDRERVERRMLGDDQPTPEFLADRYRESTSAARVQAAHLRSEPRALAAPHPGADVVAVGGRSIA